MLKIMLACIIGLGLGHGHMQKNNVSAVAIRRLIKMAFPVFHDIGIHIHAWLLFIYKFIHKEAS